MASAISVFAHQFRGKWMRLPVTTRDMSGRVIIVTGSNIGLGFETVKHFYAMNPARLIIAVRSLDKGEAAKRAILAEHTGASHTSLEVWKLDMADFASVRSFAKRCETELERIDVFIASAGIVNTEWETTKDGWEQGLQVNVISTFILCALVTPLLCKTADLPQPSPGFSFKPHLAIVSSALHKIAAFPERRASHILATLNNRSQFNGRDRYNVTKMLDILLVRQLAKSPAVGDKISVTSVDPGFCRSELMRSVPNIVRVIMYALMARTTEVGSRTYLWASLTDNIPSGSYTSDCKVAKEGSFSATKEGTVVQEKVWEELAEIAIKVAPETSAVWA